MTVEDGTGLEGADSYVSIDFADDYFDARNVDFWDSLESEEKEVLLIKATDFVDFSYKWKGRRKTEEQGLNFPRTGLVNSDGFTVVSIPVQLKQAVCECAALINESGDLFKVADANGAVTSEHIGSISMSYDVSKVSNKDTLYDSINLRLRGLYDEPRKNKVIAVKVQRS